MVFTVEVVTGPMADLLAQAQLDIIEEICAWVAHRRAAAPGSDVANDAPEPVEPD
jgi:hypothetical protein